MTNIVEKRLELRDARAKGLKQYTSKFPCKRGHFERRIGKDGNTVCIGCTAYFNKLYRGVYDKRTPDDHAERYRRYRDASPEHYWAKEAVQHARQRAKEKGWICTITVKDVESLIVKKCPVLGLTLAYTKNKVCKQESPSLDRIKSNLGYVVGNLKIISHRANTIKQDATIQELEAVLNYVRTSGGI